jgi:transcriptional regulator with XRE-family HTH domain
MHLHKITQSDLAAVLGIRRDYLNKILNGKENPANAKANITAALDKLIKDKGGR